jgi:NTE family protein
MNGKKPKRLIFAGGGTRCLVFLPALVRLEAEGILDDVEAWAGTSAGALLAALLAVGKSAVQVKKVFEAMDFSRFRDFNVANMVQFMDVWGLDDAEALQQELEKALESLHAGAAAWTLADVPALTVCVADLTDHVTLKVSAATHPTLRIVDAVRASMCFPIFYRPFRHALDGHVWVDGGLCANFMWNEFTEVEQRESLGFTFERSWTEGGPQTFTEYMQAMLRFNDPHQTQVLKAQWSSHILWFPLPPFPVWFVRFQKEDFDILEGLANQAVLTWSKHHPPSSVETPRTKQSHGDHCTPPQGSQRHHTDGMLDIQKSSCQQLHRVPFQDLPLGIPRSSRRWSL